MNDVINSQLHSLDDTDDLASAWSDALQRSTFRWGGRGQGGRGLARRTYQPRTVVVDDVRLEYVNATGLSSKLLLDNTTLKLLPQRVYSLVGRNGSGKSTLLRRINAGKIPGFPPHLSCLYVPQEVVLDPTQTPVDVVLGHHGVYFQRSVEAIQARITELEDQLEGGPSVTDGNEQDSHGNGVPKKDNDEEEEEEDEETRIERICEQIAMLEEEIEGGHDVAVVKEQAEEALRFFGIHPKDWDTPTGELSGGQCKKIALACAVFCRTDLLLLDEPTNYLDVHGLLQLRQLIQRCREDLGTTILMVSHDVDLINDVATDVIHLHNKTLSYYPGNYRDFVGYKNQKDLHHLRQNAALNKKRSHIVQTIQHLKNQPTPKRGGSKKSHRQVEVQRKRLEQLGIDKNEKGHKWKQQREGTGIKKGSINSVDATTRARTSHAQLLKRGGETSVAPAPDHAMQFVFRDAKATWGEPLIMAMDVGHGYNIPNNPTVEMVNGVEKKEGYLFDCVDLCVDEGSVVCILGENGCGKSTLLRLLAGRETPVEGTIHHAQGVTIGYFDQHEADQLVESAPSNSDGNKAAPTTALSLLCERHSQKTEHDIRAELKSFGLDPKQATTDVRFLSGGERSRLCLANLMLSDPELLIMDEPTSHLDVESVEALVYGLNQWNGTLIMVSHDANLIRSLEKDVKKCHVILPEEGKIRFVSGGIDSFLASS